MLCRIWFSPDALDVQARDGETARGGWGSRVYARSTGRQPWASPPAGHAAGGCLQRVCVHGGRGGLMGAVPPGRFGRSGDARCRLTHGAFYPRGSPRGHFGCARGQFSFPFVRHKGCFFVTSFSFLCFSGGSGHADEGRCNQTHN